MTQSKAIVIINPTAGKEEAMDHIERIKDTLQLHFSEVEIKETSDSNDARRFAKEACIDLVEAVFAVGGDGTVNEVLSGLAEEEYRPKLGIFPAGTFNALARMLRIPLDLEAAIQNFDPKLVLPIDIGRVNDKYFACVLSIGDIPDAIHDVSSSEKSDSGIFAYIKHVAAKLKHIEQLPLKLTIDGEQVEDEFSHLLVLLADRLGSLQLFKDGSDISDGKMNLILVKSQNLKDALSLLPDLIAGQIDESGQVIYRQVKHIEVSSIDDILSDIDGDEGPKLPLTIDVLERHINVYYGSESLIDEMNE